ncbi:MAG: ATP-binding protein [Acidobacteriota bacterium]
MPSETPSHSAPSSDPQIRDADAASPSDSAGRNAAALDADLAWLAWALERRLAGTLDLDEAAEAAPTLEPESSVWAVFVEHYELEIDERLAVLLALAPHVRPAMLDRLRESADSSMDTAEVKGSQGRLEAGGLDGVQHRGVLPTGETLTFLLAGDDLADRFAALELLDRDHVFAQSGILRLEPAPAGEPRLAGRLTLGTDFVDLLTLGAIRRPRFNPTFPARLLHSAMAWDDLVLDARTRNQLRELEAWVRHGETLRATRALGRRLRPGYRCLFHGPPGTGKTLTATLLGQRLERDVYRISLSTVISKFIGETEKTLEQIFQRTAALDCLLYFDEADALFGKRTTVASAHDRFANQEVAYLLQRLEDHPGVVIVASNLSTDLDATITRRFEALVQFPMPAAKERRQLWQSTLADVGVPSEVDGVDLDRLASDYELSGGGITNAVRFACLMALEAGVDTPRADDLLAGIRRELQKEGKSP